MDFDLDIISVAIGVMLAAGIKGALGLLKAFAAKTPSKTDDALVEAVEKAIQSASKELADKEKASK